MRYTTGIQLHLEKTPPSLISSKVKGFQKTSRPQGTMAEQKRHNETKLWNCHITGLTKWEGGKASKSWVFVDTFEFCLMTAKDTTRHLLLWMINDYYAGFQGFFTFLQFLTALENALKARHVTTLTSPPVALVAPAPLDCLLCHECQSPRGAPWIIGTSLAPSPMASVMPFLQECHEIRKGTASRS